MVKLGNHITVDEFENIIKQHINAVNVILKLENIRKRYALSSRLSNDDEKYRWVVHNRFNGTMNDVINNILIRFFIDKSDNCGAIIFERQIRKNLDDEQWKEIREIEAESIGVSHEPGERKIKFIFKSEEEIGKFFTLLIA